MLTRQRFNEAVSAAGGLQKVADVTGVKSIQVVSNWGSRGVPASKCRAFSALTEIPVQDLRDDWRDYWPELDVHTEAAE